MAITTFTYPTSAELQMVEREKMPELTEDDPIFQEFPITERNAAVIMWEQQDTLTGLQQVRGLNGVPGRVERKGGRRFIMMPGVYGEHTGLDEAELTERRDYATFNNPASLDDLVAEAQDYLLGRRLDRIRYIIWTLLGTGTFAVSTPSGAVAHTDSYTFQSVNSSIAWGTPGTSTPLADLRAVQLKGRGYTVSFGRDAKAYMNQVTANAMMANTNAADLGGKRATGGSTFNSVDEVNRIYLENNLPQVVVYDRGYVNDSGTWTPWIPDGIVIVIGRRPAGQSIGEYVMTRNINSDTGTGAYTKVVDTGEDTVPREIIVHDGHNGGPAIYFPSAVVVLDVTP